MNATVIPARRMRVVRHHSDLGRWELASCAPDPRLRPYVSEYQGYFESETCFTRKRHVPCGEAVLIINFGAVLRRIDPANATGPSEGRGAWFGGIRDRHVLTERTGPVHCMEVRFTPIGARQFLGLPLDQITNRAVELEDVLGPSAQLFVAQLCERANWALRFAMLDAFIAERLADARPVPEGIAWAWRTLAETAGGHPIAGLATEIGCSRKHLIAQFHEHIGLSPKVAARVLRFSHVIRCLDGVSDVRWAAIAHDCGYYDQAHFIHDFRAFAGTTPSEFLRRRLPDTGSVRED